MNRSGIARALGFAQGMRDPRSGGFRSVPGGPVTLYGTCYALLTCYFVGANDEVAAETRGFILRSQDADTGLMLGPELHGFSPAPGVLHNLEHLQLHLTCAAVPVCQHFGIKLAYPIRAAHRFCDLDYLSSWLNKRDLSHAWFEGNNLLFVGQLLVYLRDIERRTDAQRALECWFDWLDVHIDLETSLWGTDGHCTPMEAVYGGYHQLLVYYHEGHRIANPRGLVDTVLSLQHPDGGFNPRGNAGACEDVDSVDILVNLYKRFDYKRAAIRAALRLCLSHILATQNPDGGFPYNRDWPQSHMGVPGTAAPPNVSTMFPTWFRVHTLALMSEDTHG